MINMITRVTSKLLFSITKAASRPFCTKIDHAESIKNIIKKQWDVQKNTPEHVQDALKRSIQEFTKQSWSEYNVGCTESDLLLINYKMQHIVKYVSLFVNSINQQDRAICTCTCTCVNHSLHPCFWHHIIAPGFHGEFINVVNGLDPTAKIFWDYMNVRLMHTTNSNRFDRSYVSYLCETTSLASVDIILFYEKLQHNLNKITVRSTYKNIALAKVEPSKILDFNNGKEILVAINGTTKYLEMRLTDEMDGKIVLPIVYYLKH